MEKLAVHINSEIGKLEGVIIHSPGAEVENMTPENAERALYSDILNLDVALPEYNNFLEVLKKYSRVFEVRNLLIDILKNEKVRQEVIERICKSENMPDGIICRHIESFDVNELARQLIEGVEIKRDNLTRYLDNEHFSLHPLPNFFFTRDSSFSVNDRVLTARMANRVRDREAIIMEMIFRYHPAFSTQVVNPVETFDHTNKASIEGGDVLVARDDILLIGTGMRTTSQGIDAVLELLKEKPGTSHIIVQELPYKPESFIHLDMTFTFLDVDKCMIFEPLIMGSNRYLTIHIKIDNGKVVSIKEEKNILSALRRLGIDLEPVYCGGENDLTIMEREQWQSGANFFALEPGKVIGYARNIHTIETLNKHGFEIIRAKDIVKGKVSPGEYKKTVITIQGNELSRGGGGARCMTMPLARQTVKW
ncbi:MAG: arginine deiminase [Chlorobi bacterium]|nr:arginine deiminase [Chlorobiota bacterium]